MKFKFPSVEIQQQFLLRKDEIKSATPDVIKSDDGKVNDPIAKRMGTAHYSLGRVLPLKKYNEDQARDDRGRFGSGGGSSENDKLGIGKNGSPTAHNAKETYRQKYGIEDRVGKVNYRDLVCDKERAKEISDAYDKLPMDDPAAHEAYDQLASEIEQQYDFMVNDLGIKVEIVDYDPYPTAREMFNDVENNSTLKVLSTASTGSHSYFSDETNDKFRAVHDYFGHAATGRGFQQDGEEAAWVSHSSMFSKQAVSALTTETRGQNSWVNNHDSGFADQKTALLPEKYWSASESGYKFATPDVKKYNEEQARDDRGRWTSGGGDTQVSDHAEAVAGMWTQIMTNTSDPEVNEIARNTLASDGATWASRDDDVRAQVKADIAKDLLKNENLQNVSTNDLVNAAAGGFANAIGAPEGADASPRPGKIDEDITTALTPQVDQHEDADGEINDIAVVELGARGHLNVYGYADAIDLSNLRDGEVTVSQVQKGIDKLNAEGTPSRWAVAGTPEAEAMVREASVSNLVNQWAQTSNDNNPCSQAIQQAAAEQFNLDNHAEWEGMTGDLKTATDAAYAQNGDTYKAFLQAQYDNTQAVLKAAGVDSVMVYRGSTIGDPNATEATTRPISSWSTSFEVATSFSSAEGTVYRAEIPAKDILSTAGTGVGCLNEFEITVLGGTRAVSGIQGNDSLDYYTEDGGEDPAKIDAIFAKSVHGDVNKYDEDQPRDDHGRFGSGGSDEESASLPTGWTQAGGPDKHIFRNTEKGITIYNWENYPQKDLVRLMDRANQLSDMASPPNNPVSGGVRISLTTVERSPSRLESELGAVAFAQRGGSEITIYTDKLNGSLAESSMPVYKDVTEAEYVLAHEWGHIMDANSAIVSEQQKNDSPNAGASKYGNTSSRERYAEAFAQWALTNGSMSNGQVAFYAYHNNWKAGMERPTVNKSVFVGEVIGCTFDPDLPPIETNQMPETKEKA